MLSHLFFADDSLFFLTYKGGKCNHVEEYITKEESAGSGQSINLSKSSVVFSANVSKQVRKEKVDQLHMKVADNLGKYLGIRSFWGKSKCAAMEFITERIIKKLQGWKRGLLSQGGREILIKAVVCSIPIYTM